MKTICFLIIFVFSFIQLTGYCDSLPGKPSREAKYNRSLTIDELELPSVRNQANANSIKSIQVSFTPSTSKPAISWSKTSERWIFDKIIVDSDGGIWIPVKSQGPGKSLRPEYSSLKRLDQNGNLSWEKDFSTFLNTLPVIVGNGFVIVLHEFFLETPDPDFKIVLTLECLDLKGNTIWSTQPANNDGVFPSAWRLSNNRIIMSAGKSKSGEYNIYELSNGKYIETIIFPAWNDQEYDIKPIELPNGGWIGYQPGKIVCYKSDMDMNWEYKITDIDLCSEAVVSEQGILLVSAVGYIEGLDIINGLSKWRIDRSYYWNKCRGFTHDGNFLISVNDCIKESKFSTGHLVSVNDKGDIVWEQDEPSEWPGPFPDIIEYIDGSVLYGTGKDLKLINPDGSELWSVSFYEYGIPKDEWGINWNLNPLPDGKIIVSIMNPTEISKTYVFALSPPD